jgi:hypothetical protein
MYKKFYHKVIHIIDKKRHDIKNLIADLDQKNAVFDNTVKKTRKSLSELPILKEDSLKEINDLYDRFVEQEEKKLALEMEILSKKYAFLMGQDLVMMKQESSKRIKNLLRYHIQVGATKKTEV